MVGRLLPLVCCRRGLSITLYMKAYQRMLALFRSGDPRPPHVPSGDAPNCRPTMPASSNFRRAWRNASLFLETLLALADAPAPAAAASPSDGGTGVGPVAASSPGGGGGVARMSMPVDAKSPSISNVDPLHQQRMHVQKESNSLMLPPPPPSEARLQLLLWFAMLPPPMDS